MIIKNYIVCGPPRCGGLLLLSLITAAGAMGTHTHDRNHPVDDPSVTAWIDLDRVEVFDAVCSNIIANRTGQTNFYGNPNIAPFYAGKGEFQYLLQQHLDYRRQRQDRPNFARHDIFWYENFAQNWQSVWDRLQLQPNKKLLSRIQKPAPYNYRDIIINHQELRTWMTTN